MTSLNLIVIKTDNLQGQAEFYTALGIQFDYHKHGNGPNHYASVAHRPTLEIYPLPKNTTTPDNTTRLGFMVERLDVLIADLKSRGVAIVSEPSVSEWGYGAIVQDLDGRKIELTERRQV
ncbi:VOC family protein [Chryseolinea soli]|uniref:Glyoxalase/bleomycin resistance/extradiol dioxygenase family protein n=1 Tax=Chryseolinea soli TaxID=2321403 RepID=A0A385SQK3_9BACT|nr:VOC family protein [Chryseolinea soli]AYB34073.1 glyoxalase/bleomycin resistance/extradiol dioxygenase family protein [Chryseolinea soli]